MVLSEDFSLIFKYYHNILLKISFSCIKDLRNFFIFFNNLFNSYLYLQEICIVKTIFLDCESDLNKHIINMLQVKYVYTFNAYDICLQFLNL